MKQVLVKGGSVAVQDVPPPATGPGMALVRVSCSLISSGTESGFVSEGGVASFLYKKASDPLNIQKFKRKLATVGFKGTLDLVRGKLLEYQAPGYSSAGIVVETDAAAPHFRIGDRVACSGVGYACHAEYNAVPHALLTPIPDGVSDEEAAFVSLGAIAVQGARRAEPTFGEAFVVSGLGLLGQLVCQILRAAGCRVVGCDPVESKRALAASLGADAVCAPEHLEEFVAAATAGCGADGVVVCAASKDSRVTNQALRLCRKGGRTVVVGAVGLDLEREPLYLGELDFRLSCSYGPGRYDPAYEERGVEYPISHVRWTQGRNMTEFLRMVAERKVSLRPLISAREPVDHAGDAYAAVLKGGDVIAVLLTYPDSGASAVPKRMFQLRPSADRKGTVGLAVIGAGSIAVGHHLPNLQKIPECRLVSIINRSGHHAQAAANRFGALRCGTDYREALADPEVDAVLIATRHHLHAAMAMDAIAAGKHVFVEKPLALTVAECEAICAAAEAGNVLLAVGFNRRFAPLAVAAKAALTRAPGAKTLVYRCNAGPLPPGHWALDPVQGGGRIRGEAVHFFDFARWILGADPVDLCAATGVASGSEGECDDLTAALRFPGGALATVIYAGSGHASLAKERIEIFSGGRALVLDDFKELSFYGFPERNRSLRRIDKGLEGILSHFIGALQGKHALSVTGMDGLWATRIAEDALRHAARGDRPRL